MTNFIKTPSYLPLVGRLLMAVIFVFSAVGKMGAPAMTKGYIAAMGLPFADLLFVLSIVVELGGGLLLAFGFGTRITALGLAAFSIVTGLVFHHAIGDQNEMFHLLKNLAMAGGLLQVVAFGAGAFSLDARKATNTMPRVA